MMEDLVLAFGIYLVGIVMGALIAMAVFSDRRIKIDPNEMDGW